MTATPAWLAAVEALLDRGAQASPQATALLRRLDRTALQVDIVGMTSIRAGVSGGRLALTAVASTGDTTPDSTANATITGSPFALLSLARSSAGGDSRRGAPHAPAQITGDAEIANLYRQLFVAARPDVEDELSRVVGDLPARRLWQFAQRTAAWARRTRRTAAENIAEYLQEESRDLVNEHELEEFLQGVDAARETLDRVAARLTRLEQRLQDSA